MKQGTRPAVELQDLSFCRIGQTPSTEYRTKFGLVRCWSCEFLDGTAGLVLTVPPDDTTGFSYAHIAGVLLPEAGEYPEICARTAEFVAMAFVHGLSSGASNKRMTQHQINGCVLEVVNGGR